MWEEAFLKRWRKVALTTVVFVLTTVVILGRFPVVFLKSNTASLPMAELRHRMLQRTRLVNTTCHEYKSELLHHYAQWLGVSEYWQKVDPLLFVNPDVLVNRRQRLVWCKVPKVASTSFVHALLRLSGVGHLLDARVHRSHLHMVLRRMMPPPRADEDVRGFAAFMVVRHPFQRVLSAYRDKFLDRSEGKKFRKFKELYGLSIIAKHRKSEPPPEEEYYRDVPTFWEFVQYLISTPVWEYNEHWRPYYLTCSPCHHHYNFILHLETLQDDAEYLVNATGLPELAPSHVHATRGKAVPEILLLLPGQNGHDSNDKNQLNGAMIQRQDLKNGMRLAAKDLLFDVPPPKRHQEEEEEEAGDSHVNTEAKFFAKIKRHQLMELYNIFLLDFKMFGYDLSPYDAYVSD
ncbi:carbohydrate sulfotransferase 10-like isoform X2 [Macrobrachium nipponense]|uniref:carbohydrate sulfotransferase 10-like isoform X2 n=1 Tax=Macrobrachium nipponense TaxID=159736 RepID=UPI0030C825EC